MPKFHSLRSLQPVRIDDEPGEPSPASHTSVIDKAQAPFHQPVDFPRVPVTQGLSGEAEHEQHFQANPISPTHSLLSAQSGLATPTTTAKHAPPPKYTKPLYNTQKQQVVQPAKSTQALQSYQPQSLLTALQLTMEPQTNRTPIVIPAVMKKTKQRPTTQVLSPNTRRTISRFKLGIVLGALVAFIFLTAFSLGPVSQGKDTFPLVNTAIRWAQTQQQGLNVALSQSPQSLQPAQPAQDTNQAIAVVPAMPTAPTGDLVTIAQQDAIKYGISPVYFVNQIYAESGFNQYAYSPAGAVGIAQFIPSTAAALGVDPYDPVSALDGAARFMANLSAEFGGDYGKALAAYNAGSGTVINAVNAAGANWLSLMPYETQLYVQKIIG
jgi:hypothetical protein